MLMVTLKVQVGISLKPQLDLKIDGGEKILPKVSLMDRPFRIQRLNK